MGAEANPERVKIYATDADEDALTQARSGSYTDRAVAGVKPELLERYFDRANGRFPVSKDVRRLVIFGRNNLIQDAPISRVDLLVCRNTLMYFDADTQRRVLARFHFALRDDGYLFLGRAETLLSQGGGFTPFDLQRRVFTKIPRPTLQDRLLVASRSSGALETALPASRPQLVDQALEASPVAQLIVRYTGELEAINSRARALFRLGAADLGRPLRDLEVSYRPVELRSRVDEAYAQHRPVVIPGVEWLQDGKSRWFEVHVVPLHTAEREPLGVSIAFVDSSQVRELQQQLDQSSHELESAYEELQSANEELETTNEELQSTVEELETTNEELQSTNEELETMNEELQATNEELQTMNDELRHRSDELNQVNEFLQAVFTSVRAAVVVLDVDLRVTVWNARAEELWGVRTVEAEGARFLKLDIGLPLEPLATPLVACAAGRTDSFDLTLEAVNRRGRQITCRVSGTPLRVEADAAPTGVIVFMEQQPDEAEAA